MRGIIKKHFNYKYIDLN